MSEEEKLREDRNLFYEPSNEGLEQQRQNFSPDEPMDSCEFDPQFSTEGVELPFRILVRPSILEEVALFLYRKGVEIKAESKLGTDALNKILFPPHEPVAPSAHSLRPPPPPPRDSGLLLLPCSNGNKVIKIPLDHIDLSAHELKGDNKITAAGKIMKAISPTKWREVIQRCNLFDFSIEEGEED